MALMTLNFFQNKFYSLSCVKLRWFEKIFWNTHLDYCSCKVDKKQRKTGKILTKQSMNQQIVKMEFAVKGPVLLRALKHKAELERGIKKPFSELIYTNQGDSHAMGQPAITFVRQVLAVCVYPKLLNYSAIPDDVKERAQTVLSGCLNHSMGAYTDSQGISKVRRHIAEFISKRDNGIPSDPNNIFIMDGASPAIKLILSLFCKDIRDKPTGIMVPIPLYPLYTAVMTELNLHPINYYLDEEKNWGLNMAEIQKSIDKYRCDCTPRAIVVINPGNPTGQVLSRKNIEDLIKFAYKEKLVIFADEVYQENILDEECEFHSFKKVKHELGPPYDKMELASFMSISKGYTGECGLRGGCAEVDCFDKDVHATLVKAASVSLCSNTVGQATLSCIAKPPEFGNESFEEFMREKCCILNGTAAKAKLITCRINKIKGLKVNKVQGAMYAMVKVDIPERAKQAAKERGLLPDEMWCYDLLDSKGIVVVPGSGFGQKPGTYHFRTTILPPFEVMEKMLKGLKEFQDNFTKKYA